MQTIKSAYVCSIDIQKLTKKQFKKNSIPNRVPMHFSSNSLSQRLTCACNMKFEFCDRSIEWSEEEQKINIYITSKGEETTTTTTINETKRLNLIFCLQYSMSLIIVSNIGTSCALTIYNECVIVFGEACWTISRIDRTHDPDKRMKLWINSKPNQHSQSNAEIKLQLNKLRSVLLAPLAVNRYLHDTGCRILS